VVAGLATLIALFLLGTTRSSNVVCRLLLVGIGGAAAYVGGYLIYLASTVDSATPSDTNAVVNALKELGSALSHIQVQPGAGAYAMAAGGGLIALGGLIPSSKRFVPWLPSSPPPVPSPPAWSSHEAGPAGLPVAHSPRRRYVLAILLVLVVAGIALGGIALTKGRPSSMTFGGGEGAAQAPAITVSPTERRCVDTVTSRETSLQEILSQSSTAENVARFSHELTGIDLSGCPTLFVLTHQQWSQAWGQFADFLTEANKFHAPWNSEWSKDRVDTKRKEYQAQIHSRRDALDTMTEAMGVPVKVHWDWPS
jgi:hypothetical protein